VFVSQLPEYAELPRLQNSNLNWRHAWGVFGDRDELGTLNLLTPQRRLDALKLATVGLTINLDHALNLPLSILPHRKPYVHNVFEIMPGFLDETLDHVSPQLSSQWDALRHVRSPQGFYNDVADGEIVANGGRLGIDTVAELGIVGRGVLLDVASYFERRGDLYDARSRCEVSVSVLDAVADDQNVELRDGDILLIRFGVDRILEEVSHTGAEFAYQSPGLAQEAETLEWLWNRHVAAVCADNIAVEVTPTRSQEERLHPAMIGLLGITLGELFNLRLLAETAERLNRYDFLFLAKPLLIPGGVGSPANALAMF
jgi:kynurenine formamidase